MASPLAYYNENDAFAAAWLRELIAAGLIAPGDVDERSIEDVRPADLNAKIAAAKGDRLLSEAAHAAQPERGKRAPRVRCGKGGPVHVAGAEG